MACASSQQSGPGAGDSPSGPAGRSPPPLPGPPDTAPPAVRRSGRPQPPLPGHQLIALPGPADGQGLQNAAGADAGRQLRQALLIEAAAGLLGVGPDAAQGMYWTRVDRNSPFRCNFMAFDLPFPHFIRRRGQKGRTLSGNQNFPRLRPGLQCLRRVCGSVSPLR